MTAALTAVPIAHSVHWLEPLLYTAPFVLMVVLVLVANLRHRRGGRPGPS